MMGGTVNQFKMETIDFNLPAVTVYERFIHKIEKGMTLLFALNEFIEGGVNLDTSDMMERCLKARDDLVQYMNVLTNLMHFGLCFGFFMDFWYNLQAGIYNAVPWAGAFSLGLAIVTPFQGGIGILSDLFTSKALALRMKEVKVPAFIRKWFPAVFPIGRESFVIKFGPIGQKLQKISFYFAMVNGFISATMVAISYLTASMYAIHVKANWDTLQYEMPGMSMEMAMKRASMSISGLGDSAAGLFVILSSGITTAAYNLGGMSWLIVHVVEMEKFFVMGCGSMVFGLGLKLSLDCPAGNFLFVPMGGIGSVTAFLGVVQAVPWFQKKFPDLMYMLHKAQVILCCSLGALFVLMTQMARDASGFVERNWDGCEYQVCSLPGGFGDADFSMSKYAASQGVSKEDLQGLMKPLFYSAGIANASTCLIILGGSNLAKIMYFKNVMSRKEEATALKSGQGQAEVRKSALVKKVRRTREADIKEVQAEMQNSGIVKLEEDALMMEFATAIPMEEHYDLIEHDELIASLGSAANTEKLAGDSRRGVAALAGGAGGMAAGLGLSEFMEDDPDMDFTSNLGLAKMTSGDFPAMPAGLPAGIPDPAALGAMAAGGSAAAAMAAMQAGMDPAALQAQAEAAKAQAMANMPAGMDPEALKAKAMEAAEAAMGDNTAKLAEAQAALDGAKKKKDKKAAEAAEAALGEQTAKLDEAKVAMEKVQAGDFLTMGSIPGMAPMPPGFDPAMLSMEPAALQAQAMGALPPMPGGLDPAALGDPAAMQAATMGALPPIPGGLDPAALTSMDPAAMQAAAMANLPPIPGGLDPAALAAMASDPAAIQDHLKDKLPPGMDPKKLKKMDPAALAAMASMPPDALAKLDPKTLQKMDPVALTAMAGMDPAALANMDPKARQDELGKLPKGMDPEAMKAQLGAGIPGGIPAMPPGVPGGMPGPKAMLEGAGLGAGLGALSAGGGGGKDKFSAEDLENSEFFSTHRQDNGTGVQETGSSLASLARQLQKSGNYTEDSAMDDRAGEQLPLDIRLQGAKQLLARAKFDTAGWGGINIFTKRDAMYTVMHEDNEEQGGMGDMLPSAKLNKLFSKRL